MISMSAGYVHCIVYLFVCSYVKNAHVCQTIQSHVASHLSKMHFAVSVRGMQLCSCYL